MAVSCAAETKEVSYVGKVNAKSDRNINSVVSLISTTELEEGRGARGMSTELARLNKRWEDCVPKNGIG